MDIETSTKKVCERKKDTEMLRDTATASEISHFNGHLYGLGELGGSQTAPLQRTVQKTPVG